MKKLVLALALALAIFANASAFATQNTDPFGSLNQVNPSLPSLTVNLVGIGTTSPSSNSLLDVRGAISSYGKVTNAAGRAVNTGTTSDTIAASIASTYESANSATTTLTFAAPTGDGERRRICLKNAATVTWAVTSPATAVAGLPTTFIAGQCVEAIYNSASGTPANAPATTWVVY